MLALQLRRTSLRSICPGLFATRSQYYSACRAPIRDIHAAASSSESSVARGTRFELLCQNLLRQMFGMDLERTGGAGDKGVDLRGWWTLPAPTNLQQEKRIRVLAQCKCQDEGGKKMGPVLIREVEGVVHRASSPVHPSSDRVEAVVGIILSSSGFSKQALLQVRSSTVPLVAVHVKAEDLQSAKASPLSNNLGERCLFIVWNERFASRQHGLLGDELEVRWQRSLDPHSISERPLICLSGKPLL